MIISGGENIHPFEVECVLSEAPGVEEVVVVGVKDQRWGQCVSACVVAKADHHLSEETLDLFCRESGLADRSEEHTSELQSLMRISYAVFCLKKKINTTM